MKLFPQFFQRLKKDRCFRVKEYSKCWVTVNENRSTQSQVIGNFSKIGGNGVYEILEKEKSCVQELGM